MLKCVNCKKMYKNLCLNCNMKGGEGMDNMLVLSS